MEPDRSRFDDEEGVLHFLIGNGADGFRDGSQKGGLRNPIRVPWDENALMLLRGEMQDVGEIHVHRDQGQPMPLGIGEDLVVRFPLESDVQDVFGVDSRFSQEPASVRGKASSTRQRGILGDGPDVLVLYGIERVGDARENVLLLEPVVFGNRFGGVSGREVAEDRCDAYPSALDDRLSEADFLIDRDSGCNLFH